MRTTQAFLAGTIAGAGVVYFFDPRMGNRRRVMIEDKLRRYSHRTVNAVDAGIRDLENRGQGILHDVGSLLGLSRARNDGRERAAAGRGRRFKWSPGPRLLTATCGTALIANCLARRTPGAILLGTLGFGLFTRAMSG
ncbi:MAG TPA: YtxH domain-containing protein, partial [Pirellulaceae bacterium]|nr:YtxH domain-containing protein [Pirellulaceae bacterium]